MSTPLPPVPVTLKMVMQHQLGDDLNLDNVLHFTYNIADEPLSAAQVAVLALDGFNAWSTHLMPVLSSGLTFVNCQVTDLSLLTGNQADNPGSVAGGVAGGTLPGGTAMVVKLLTPLRGRSFRGRVFLGGIPPSYQQTAQEYFAADVIVVANAYEAFVNGFNASNGALSTEQVIVSYFSGKVPNPNLTSNRRFVPSRRVSPLTSGPCVSSVDQRVASQRRRNA
jgi:hypothetical protein